METPIWVAMANGDGFQTRKRPTQADVARLAAVSQPVVSYVLSGNPEAPVAPATRDRVLKAIAELGYVPDHTARSLRRRRTLTIAAIIPDITNPFYPALARAVQDVAEGAGYDLNARNTDGDPERERKCLRSLPCVKSLSAFPTMSRSSGSTTFRRPASWIRR